MGTSKTLNVLKNAFLLEQQGKNLYQQAMENAKNDEVKLFFQSLVNDEKEHMEIIVKQHKSYVKNKKFTSSPYEKQKETVNAPAILNDSLKEKINAASFEATAITAAISFEKKAVDLYSNRAEEATDPEEKKMYKWLSTWEKTHLNKLVDLEESLIAKVWDDNNFWPF
jgi:rubrerythrin